MRSVETNVKGCCVTQHDVVRSSYAFEGKIINLRVDTVKLADGSLRQREIVEHPGAVAVVPVLDDGRIVLVRQFRPAVGKQTLELPAGTVEPDEDVHITAGRELEEETGYRAANWRELVRFYVSPGWCNEELVIYVAADMVAGKPDTEDDEEISVVALELSAVPELIRTGEICDAKTLVGIATYSGISLLPEPR
jgi:8-oxo-dGTP pyrophosphatase MutT (NUDIX family)